MKEAQKICLIVIALLLLGSWVNVSASVSEVEIIEEPELVLTKQEIVLRANQEVDPHDYVVSGTYDELHYPIINTNESGYQTLTYRAVKGQNEVKKVKVIQVLDGKGPVIEGEDEIVLKYDSDFDIAQEYKAIDKIDGEVDVEVVGEVNRTQPGEYMVHIRAIDSHQNETLKEIKVVVNEDPEVVALRERNEAYKTLVAEATTLNGTLLKDTSVSEVESMLSRVNSAKANESDYTDQLTELSNELTAKLTRAQEFHAPVTSPTVTQAPTPSQTTTTTTPVVESTPTYSSDDRFNATLTRYGMDCVGCVVRDGVAYTSHGIALTATAVLQPNGVWQEGITYNGRYIFAGNRNRINCTLLTLYDHPYEGRGIQQGVPIHGVIADNGAFGYNHLDLFVGTETNLDVVAVVNPYAQPYAIITGFGTFTGSGCSF